MKVKRRVIKNRQTSGVPIKRLSLGGKFWRELPLQNVVMDGFDGILLFTTDRDFLRFAAPCSQTVIPDFRLQGFVICYLLQVVQAQVTGCFKQVVFERFSGIEREAVFPGLPEGLFHNGFGNFLGFRERYYMMIDLLEVKVDDLLKAFLRSS